MSLDISIRVNPEQALAASMKVEQSLGKVEKAGEKAGTGIAAGARTGSTAQDKLRANTEMLARSFGGVAEALGREAAMLKSIHGPMQQLAQDIQTLDMLSRKGAISAEQHAAALAKSKSSAGVTGSSASGEVVGAIGGQIAGMVGPAALAAAAVKGITEELERMSARRRDVDAASNAILKFHESVESVNGAMAEQRQLSEDLHINIRRTAAAYGAVREASADMYLTSAQQIDITRNLTAAIVADGGAIEDVSGIMQKFQIAMEFGTMSAKELKSIMTQSDDVMSMMEKSTGKTYKELMDLAKAGKLNTEILAKAVTGFATNDDAMKKYAMRTLDVRQVQDELNVSMWDAVGVIADAKDAYQASMPTMAELFLQTVNANLKFHASLEDVRKAMENLDQVTSQWTNTLSRTMGVVGDLSKKLPGLIDGFFKGLVGYDAWDPSKTTKKLDKIFSSAEKANAEINKMQSLSDAVGGFGRVKRNKEWAAEDEANSPENLIGELGGGPSIPDAMAARKSERDKAVAGDMANMRAGAIGAGMTYNKEQAENAKKVEESTVSINDIFAAELVNNAQTFSGALVDAANGADVSWSQTFENMIVGLQKAIVQALILKAITGSYSGAAGADGNYGGLMGLAGFASGGMIMPSGGGGTDSQVVAFRKSPDETVRIHTPQQEAAYARGGSKGQTTVIEDRRDPRALMQGGADTNRVVIDAIRANPGAIRALLSK